MAHGFGHEAQLDPLAALLEILETFKPAHLTPDRAMDFPGESMPQKKRRGLWAAPRFSEFLLYIFSISI
jgi:hypothetical protein